MIVKMVCLSNFWLNSFHPDDDGATAVLSPHAIVAGLQLNCAKHCQLKFGTCVQNQKERTKSVATRTPVRSPSALQEMNKAGPVLSV